MKEGIFPSALKYSEVIPIFKSGSKKLTTNWRPITLLNPFSKIFERCIYNRLNNFFKINGTIYKNQFGFQKKISTENAVLKIYNEIAKRMEEGEYVLSLFLDLKKAFDTVDHQLLLSKLYKYGIRGNAYHLLKSFLTDRQQCTLVNGCKSSYKRVQCGVPQGSTLGPLLFIIYINDFYKCSEFNLNLFADDAYLSLYNSSPESLEHKTNQQLTNVKNWLQVNKLTLNTSKSTYIVFSKAKSKYQFQVKIGEEILEQAESVKYLGIVIDKTLCWKPHINKVGNKISSSCWAMSKIRNLMTEDVLKQIYYSIVYPHLQYCVSCWGGVPPTTLNRINVLQRRAIRTICKVSRDENTSELFHKLNLLKMKDIYHFRLSIIMHSMHNGIWVGMEMMKVKELHNYETRFSTEENFCLPIVKSNIGKCSFNFMGPKAWSNVPSNLKVLPIHEFKKNFMQILIEKY